MRCVRFAGWLVAGEQPEPSVLLARKPPIPLCRRDHQISQQNCDFGRSKTRDALIPASLFSDKTQNCQNSSLSRVVAECLGAHDANTWDGLRYGKRFQRKSATGSPATSAQRNFHLGRPEAVETCKPRAVQCVQRLSALNTQDYRRCHAPEVAIHCALLGGTQPHPVHLFSTQYPTSHSAAQARFRARSCSLFNNSLHSSPLPASSLLLLHHPPSSLRSFVATIHRASFNHPTQLQRSIRLYKSLIVFDPFNNQA